MQVDTTSLPAFFLLFVAFVWTLIYPWGSYYIGWMRFTARFRSAAVPPPYTPTARPLLYRVHWRFLSNDPFVKVRASADALYLSKPILFRPFHPPLRIPWEEITVERVYYLMGDRLRLTLGLEERIPLFISFRMARKLGIMDRVPEAGNAIQGRASAS
jgi:hypothetical protein